MSEDKQATSRDELERRLMNTTVPKSELEWYASRRIFDLEQRENMLLAKIEAFALARDNAEGMAGCMDMLVNDMVRLGVVPKGTAPMFMTEAIGSYIGKLKADAERYRWLREAGGDQIPTETWWEKLGDMLGPEFDAAIDEATAIDATRGVTT